jgi:hypothetical protein
MGLRQTEKFVCVCVVETESEKERERLKKWTERVIYRRRERETDYN